MSMFDAPARDAASGVEATAGPARGFAESVSHAYDAGFRAMSQFGVDYEIGRANDAQDQAIFERTGKRGRLTLMDGNFVAPFGGAGGLGDFYENGGTPERADALAKYDAEIEAIRGEHPDLKLKTSREMWEGVKSAAVEAEHLADGPGSTIGHFLGGAGAGLDPRVNPFNTLTLGVGGVGKTVLGRIGTEGLAQSGIQAVNELTGVNRNRRLLGLETGAGQSLSRIGQAGLAGSLIRGGFEGAGRLFRGRAPQVADPATPAAVPPSGAIPDPIAPVGTPATRAGIASDADGPLFRDFEDFEEGFKRPQSEQMIDEVVEHTTRANLYGRSRLATARHEADVASVEAQLQDFRRSGPVRIGGDTASITPPTHAELTVPHWMRTADERVPAIAREVDPELYQQADKLDRMILVKRAQLDGLRGGAEIPAARADALDVALNKADELEDDIGNLRDQLTSKKFSKATRGRIEKQIGELEALQRSVLEPHAKSARPAAKAFEDKADVIKELADLTAERRALKPLINRAEDVAAQRFEDGRAKGETFEIMADLLRRQFRIGEDAPAFQTRRPSEQPTVAEGGSELTPGTRRRPGTTSGPNPAVKLNDGSAIDRLIDDVSHENANASEGLRAAFEAAGVLTRIKNLDVKIAEAAPGADGKPATGTAALKAEREALANGEVVIGNRRYKLDDDFVVGVKKDADGNVMGVETQKVRDLLKEFNDDADMLQAMKGCSI